MRGGEGGDDSKLFAEDLFSAYVKYAKSKGFQCTLLGSSDGHYAMQITGAGVWNVFQHEIGKHCVQRVPPTERNGRRQTSFLTVGVLPVMPELTIQIPESEIDTKTQGGHGKGGQHQNTTDSAVRMRHIPTGLQVFINGRDQHQNKREARRLLVAKVADHYQSQQDAEYSKMRKGQLGDAGRGGDKIRTYNFIQSRAVDHRTGKKTSEVRRVVEKGEFDRLK